jgi:hypothetical protein
VRWLAVRQAIGGRGLLGCPVGKIATEAGIDAVSVVGIALVAQAGGFGAVRKLDPAPKAMMGGGTDGAVAVFVGGVDGEPGGEVLQESD